MSLKHSKNKLLFGSVILFKWMAMVLLFCPTSCKNIPIETEWVSTTEDTVWKKMPTLSEAAYSGEADIVIDPDRTEQIMEGFGSSFNELGWLSLNELKEEDREYILRELFAPGAGASFSVCRMPIGANDFSSNWYSYNESAGDFNMVHFSVKNDQETLIPFILNAKKYNPELKIWASPWSPPTWMKYNGHYACRSYMRKMSLDPKYHNDLPVENEGAEGTDMFIQDPEYLQAYALYFSKFIDAYKREGIDIYAVMPQNEFNSCQLFPSCCWKASSLANFIGSYLGPQMDAKGVDILFGTMERPSELLVDTVLNNPACRRYVKGVGFQWAGKHALPGIRNRYPDMVLYQTEQECGNGKNDWKGAMYSWNLMKHYLNHGVSVYEYWNTSLLKGGISRWGWAQNSLVVVDAEKRSYEFTYEYYLLKHLSHFVMPGALKLSSVGDFSDVLAFKNPDNSLVVMIVNQSSDDREVHIKIDEIFFSPVLSGNSINSFKIKNLL